VRYSSRARLFLGLLMLFTISSAFAQAPQPFSADMSTTSANGNANVKGKFFLSLPKMRVDITDTGQQRQAGPFGGKMTMLMDAEAKMAYMLMPEQQMYMEFPMTQDHPMLQQMPKLQNLQSDPCAGHQDVTCKKVGTETVNGRSCDKWEATKKDGQKDIFWVDQKLHFPIKSQTGHVTTEFTNIKEGAPDPALFKVPAGYRKFDAGAFGGQKPR
jgi:outer membrane lipoprotein-sorting protein